MFCPSRVGARVVDSPARVMGVRVTDFQVWPPFDVVFGFSSWVFNGFLMGFQWVFDGFSMGF